MEQKDKSNDAEVLVQALPLTGIVELEPASDVQCDSGSKSLLQHDAFSSLLTAHLNEFDAASKIQKPIIALDVLNGWRRMHQGRLVKLDTKRNLWNDVGDRKGRELIGRALRKLSNEKSGALPNSSNLLHESGKDGTGSTIERYNTLQSMDASQTQSKVISSTAISSPLASFSSENPENVLFNVAVTGKDNSESSRRISAMIRQNASRRCLYGRQKEQQLLRQLYRESVSNYFSSSDNSKSNGPQKSNFLLISGASGVGKTELVMSLKALVNDDKGIFIHVPFEQLAPEESFTNFIMFLNQTAKIVLDIEDSDLQRLYCDKIAQEVTENLDERLVSEVPCLDQVMKIASIGSSRQAKPQENPRKQAFRQPANQIGDAGFAEGALSIPRLRYSLIKIMKAVASPDHPLVLFVDDIQYSGSSAYDGFFEEMALDQSGIFMIATCGQDDITCTSNQKISVTDFISQLNPNCYDVHYCQLGTLSSKAVHELITEALSMHPTELVNLSEILFGLTGGNALFLFELLRHFQEDDLLSYDKVTQQWTCDTHLLKQHPLLQVRSLHELFFAKLSDMPDEAQETFKIASVIGSNFSRNVIVKVMDTDDASSCCELGIQAGLLTRYPHHIPSLGTSEEVLAFRHDIIHKAIYDLIPDSEKCTLTFQLGMRLWRRVKDEEEMESFIFIILKLISRGGDEFLDDEKTDRVAIASLCLQAATKASKAIGFDQSIIYLEFGMRVLGQQRWRKHYDICLALFNSAIEAYYGTGDFEKVMQLVEEVMSRARVFEDTIQARMMKIYTFGTTARFLEAVDFGLETTSMLGENMCKHPSPISILKNISRTRRLVRKSDCDKLVQLPLMTDPKMTSVMLMYTFLFTPAYFRHPKLAVLICCRMIDITIRFGALPVSSIAFAAIGAVLTRDGKNTEEAFSYGKIALSFSDRFGGDAWNCRVASGVFGCINIWHVPLQNCLPPLKRAYLIGLGNGDIDTAILNASLYAWNSVDSLPITATCNFIQSLFDRMSFLGQKHSALVPLKPLFHMCKSFMGQANGNPKNINDCINVDQEYEYTNDITSFLTCAKNISFYSMILAYHFSDFKLAESLTRSAGLLYHNLSSLGAAFGRMYHSLVLLERASSSKSCKRHRIHLVRRNLKVMRQWSKNCPENFLGKQFLVEAELAAVVHNHPEAKTKYYMAIIQSRDSGLLWQEALANELAGKFYLKIRHQSEAIPFLEEARRIYKEWGGIAKLEHFETEIEEHFGESSTIFDH